MNILKYKLIKKIIALPTFLCEPKLFPKLWERTRVFSFKPLLSRIFSLESFRDLKSLLTLLSKKLNALLVIPLYFNKIFSTKYTQVYLNTQFPIKNFFKKEFE